MARRLESALGSIFLPSSVYAQLDNPTPSQAPHPTNPQPLASPSTLHHNHHPDTIDPFSAQSPSVLSPASTKGGIPLASPPLRAPEPQPPPLHGASAHPQDPFHPDPIDSVYSHARETFPDGGESVFVARTGTSPSRTRGGGGASQSVLGSSVNQHGATGRSIMSMLGGTRYEVGGYDGLGVGGDVLEEDENLPDAGTRRMPSLGLAASRRNQFSM